MQRTGIIKWFNPSHGFGFIEPDDGGLDVFLHVHCLRRAGIQTAPPGARITFEAESKSKGPFAARVIKIDESAAKRQQSRRVPIESEWFRATVKWFRRLDGFGFLTRGKGAADIFCHMETLKACGFAELRPGQVVEVRTGYTRNGDLEAADLRVAQ